MLLEECSQVGLYDLQVQTILHAINNDDHEWGLELDVSTVHARTIKADIIATSSRIFSARPRSYNTSCYKYISRGRNSAKGQVHRLQTIPPPTV